MQRVRRIGGNFCISLRRDQGAVRERGDVVRMNDVMSQPRMGRVLLEQFLEYRTRLESICVGLVAGVLRNRQRQGVKYLCFIVLRIFARNDRHGIAVGEQAKLLRHLFRVVI